MEIQEGNGTSPHGHERTDAGNGYDDWSLNQTDDVNVPRGTWNCLKRNVQGYPWEASRGLSERKDEAVEEGTRGVRGDEACSRSTDHGVLMRGDDGSPHSSLPWHKDGGAVLREQGLDRHRSLETREVYDLRARLRDNAS